MELGTALILIKKKPSSNTEATEARHRAGRNAIEMVYDTIVFEKIRKEQLLSKIWDWSSTVTIDGGNLNVGGAGESGLQILSFSTAIKHGGLGICPTFQAKG